MHERAPAKVNLYLRVVDRRADGYHMLDSVAVFPGAADLLHAAPADDLTLLVRGPFGAGLAAEPDNLVLRAARALAAAAGVRAGAALTLEKNLPVASGIGGGSADAAAALRLLQRLWGIAPDSSDMMAIAAGLGADVPVCLASGPARMGGVGEVLGPAPALPPYGMALVNPGVAVATPAVFRARAPGFSPMPHLPQRWDSAAAMAQALAPLGNDLEAAATALHPVIGAVLDWLRARPGCLLARMSGSGATCFGLFADDAAAALAAAEVPAGWWGWGG
jgi:4-diphosphocytidyl-2-C-methyl-D-erythritol kinase